MSSIMSNEAGLALGMGKKSDAYKGKSSEIENGLQVEMDTASRM